MSTSTKHIDQQAHQLPDAAHGHGGYMLVAAIYLFGLFIGALDSGIVTPARIIIQADLGVDDSFGVWILTIYTLAYASSIPIMGKLADIFGRKPIYLLCIVLFGVGSALCAFSQTCVSFEMLIGARVIQAIGGGGIMPIATAEVGTSFPPEKRGMALGLVGAVYGVASVFGASAGSLILDIFGQHNWMWIFLINVPICVFVVAFGLLKLPNSHKREAQPLDLAGIAVLTIMVLSLMYYLKSVDFFDFATSMQDLGVWPFLMAFIVLLPIFVLIEKRAADPVMNLSYFKDRDIIITLICALASGVILMGVVFLPQFCENALYMPSGDGGYFIIILGIFTGVASPMSGKMIDKHGVKPLLAAGFLFAVAGCVFTAFVACPYPNLITVCVSLALLGLGMGFTMGTPINYMMLQKTDEAEANSALAVLSLVRSIGTAVAPALMVAFIVHAGAGMQDRLMEVMPDSVTVSPLPYAQELDDEIADLKADEDYAEMLEGIDIPTLMDYTTMEVDMNKEGGDFDVEIDDAIIDEFQDGDITTVVATSKKLASNVFAQVKPGLIEDVQSGIDTGLSSMRDQLGEMDDAIAEMSDGAAEMTDGMGELTSGITKLKGKVADSKKALSTMNKTIKTMDGSISDMDEGIAGVKSGLSEMKKKLAAMKAAAAAQNNHGGSSSDSGSGSSDDAGASDDSGATDEPSGESTEGGDSGEGSGEQSGTDEGDSGDSGSGDSGDSGESGGGSGGSGDMSAAIKALEEQVAAMEGKLSSMQDARSQMKAARDKIAKARDGLKTGKLAMEDALSQMKNALSEMKTGYADLKEGQSELIEARLSLGETVAKLEAVRDAVPATFDEAEENYLAAIEDNGAAIQEVYQSTLNEGFAGLFILTGICSFVGLVLTFLYRDDQARARKEARRKQEEEAVETPAAA